MLSVKTPQEQMKELKANGRIQAEVYERFETLSSTELNNYKNNEMPLEKLQQEVTTVNEFLFIFTCLHNFKNNELIEKMNELNRWEYLADMEDPDNVNHIEKLKLEIEAINLSLDDTDADLDCLGKYFEMLTGQRLEEVSVKEILDK